MDWRSLPYIPSFGLRTIMALIVESGSNREWHFCHRRVGRKPSKCIVTAGDCLWPNRNHGPVLTSILLVILCLARPIVCSRERELHLPDYAILSRYARTLSNPCDELAGSADSTTKQSAPPEPGTMLTLSELVTQSDVIFKAFAGHGNDLREVALNFTSMPTVASEHHQQQQQQHHQPRWKPQPADAKQGPGADFIVRLEPGTVYKGNELFKQLQLNSWKHYFILWSNGSVQYTHRDEPIQGRTAAASIIPPGSTPVDTKTAVSSSGPPSRRIAEPITMEKPTKPDCLNSRHRRQLEESTQSAAKADRHDDSLFAEIERNANNVQPIVTDNSIDTTAHNLDSDRASGPMRAYPKGDHQRKPLSADERVNLQQTNTSKNESTLQTGETPAEEAVPKSIEKDLKAKGQISRTLSEILPVTLIVFGRLGVVGGNDGGTGDAGTDKLLRVDPYVGLLRWDDQLEGALWEALGWSAWSDYTSCSVACGGGVQQRFRHCLKPATETRSAASVEIENHPAGSTTTERTQPVAYGAPPGVSIERTNDGHGTWKGKLKSKPTETDGRQRRMKFLEKVNEKSIMNPSMSEPISSEAGSQWTPTLPGKSVPLHGRLLMKTTRQAKDGTAAADDGSTWPVCEGHNIEQRKCNMFECAGTINLLTALTPNYHWRSWDEVIDERINYQINQLDQNFTLMMSLRLKTDDDIGLDPSATGRPISGHIFSVRSKLTTGSSLSINFETDGHGGLRVLQEKYGLSEMLPVRAGKFTLRDGDWHSLALSGRDGGFVTVYIDCQWMNSFVLTKGSIELPQYPIVEIGPNVELRQLTVVPGEKSARLQCNSQPVPIHDVENRRVTNYFEHLH